MESATALHTRIDELSTEIDTQKQVLRDLEARRSQARRDLNSILDPMARLPVEISSDIFMRCLPDQRGPDPDLAPMLFLRICHLWSSIALSTPSLWSSIHCGDCLDAQNLELWLTRTRSLPLTLTMDVYLSPEVPVVVKKYARQLQTLTLCVQSPEQLEEMIAPFPSLEKLNVINTEHDYRDSYLWDCMDALRAAPALVECEFVDMYYKDGEDDLTPLTHPCLRRLRLGRPRIDLGGNITSAHILTHLTLPALETLLISELDISDAEFMSFLTRSMPPLRSLYISTYRATIDAGLLRLVPSLTDLTLDFREEYGMGPVDVNVVGMMASATDFLPNLRNLTIRGWAFDADYCETVVHVLSQRTRLQSFQVFFPLDDPRFKPVDHVLAALCQLAENGMQIHIGPDDHNYI